MYINTCSLKSYIFIMLCSFLTACSSMPVTDSSEEMLTISKKEINTPIKVNDVDNKIINQAVRKYNKLEDSKYLPNKKVDLSVKTSNTSLEIERKEKLIQPKQVVNSSIKSSPNDENKIYKSENLLHSSEFSHDNKPNQSSSNNQQAIVSNTQSNTNMRIEQNPNKELSTPTIPLGNKRLYMLMISVLLLIIVSLLVVMKLLQSKFRQTQKNYKHAQSRIKRLNIDNIEDAQKTQRSLQETIEQLKEDINKVNKEKTDLESSNNELLESYNKLSSQVENKKRRLSRIKELYKSIEYSTKHYHDYEVIAENYNKEKILNDIKEAELWAPSVLVNLKYMNYKDLRKEFRAYQKQIDWLLEEYKKRYRTKTNQAIYKLMVMALRSELQNILYNLKYDKLDNGIEQVKEITSKYFIISSEGNQNIANTLKKFIGEIEYLFVSVVKVEYEYYIKKEQSRQEQLALKQKMREEAEEQKHLKEQKEQIDKEESKYKTEIENIAELIKSEPADSSRIINLEAKIEELKQQLETVSNRKDEITKLQNGKAGNVYIISNIGSFGENIFKIGMTRRLDPQERVNELGSASVPFKFDVHSFIFSDDAVYLENELHKRLNQQRLNKVNRRKEFFNISVDALEQLVLEINPTAEFNTSIAAEEYRQSLSLNGEDIQFEDMDSYNDSEIDEEALVVD